MGQLQAALTLLARVCMGIPFVIYGALIVPNWGGYSEQLTAENIPFPPIFLVIAIIFLVLGGISLILGYKTRVGVILLIVTLVCATLTIGSIWQLGGMDAPSCWALWNNVALVGGLIYVLTFGAGNISFDRRKGDFSGP